MQLMVGLSGEERVFTPWRRSLGQLQVIPAT